MPTASRIGVLNIKLGACLTGPTRRLMADLEEAEKELARVRNAIVRHWERWHEDHPDYEPKQRTGRDGKPKTNKDGKPVMELRWLPQELERSMYACGAAAAQHVAAVLVTTVNQEVIADLKARLPFSHPGKARFVHEAILLNELPRPMYRPQGIPVPNNSACFAYCGNISRVLSKKTAEFTIACAAGGAVLRFPLFGSKSGREITNPIVKLEVRQLSEGNRKLLQRIADGSLKLSDSKIGWKPGKKNKPPAWFFQLHYAPPTRNLGLDPERTATLFPLTGDSESPFVIFEPDGFKWQVGHGKAYKQELYRLKNRRREIQAHFAKGVGKGHGKARFFDKTKPLVRAAEEARRQFVGSTIAEIVKFLRRNNCGAVYYREPGLKARKKAAWFGMNDVEFDWTSFGSQLAYKLDLLGVSVGVERISGRELFERFGAKAPETAENEGLCDAKRAALAAAGVQVGQDAAYDDYIDDDE